MKLFEFICNLNILRLYSLYDSINVAAIVRVGVKQSLTIYLLKTHLIYGVAANVRESFQAFIVSFIGSTIATK